MESKIRVAAVDYLNTKPLIYGFEKGMMQEKINLHTGYPSKIARMLIHDEVDIGLVPVAVIPELSNYQLITDHCIGCNGAVRSVCLFSDVPFKEIQKVYLDYQSRTSVALFKILLNEYWKISPELIEAKPGYESLISNDVAGLVIGDRALVQRQQSRYTYDLGSAWKELTGLPFMFAAWITNKKLPEAFIKEFSQATSIGFQNLDDIIRENPFDAYDLHRYYAKDVDYTLDENKKEALKLFLEKMKVLK